MFPSLQVAGGRHSPGILRDGAAQALSALSLAGVAYVFVGSQALSLIGVEEPAPLAAFRENRLLALGGYFVGNFLTTQLKSTGAFEVFLDGELLFSKLKTGRAPRLEEVAAAVAAAGFAHDARAASLYGLDFLGSGPRAPEGSSAEFE